MDSGETHQYEAVVIANGHHWHPRLPQPAFRGEFDGEELHSSDYKIPEPYMDKNVLVVGIGNSGVDIAVDISRFAKQVYLSTRSGAYVIPKYLLGKPTDQWVTPLTSILPTWLQSASLDFLRFLTVGRQRAYGVPVPKTPMYAQHPTISSDLLHYVGHGKIKMKPNIDYKDVNDIVFDDGSRETIDSIIYATGYDVRFPFLDKSIINTENNEVSLYHLTVHPEHQGLYMIGLCQPLGAIMPISERQSIWVADLIEGLSSLPSKTEMMQEIEDRQNAMFKRYDKRPRHTIQVDFFTFMDDLQQEIKAGKSRAR